MTTPKNRFAFSGSAVESLGRVAARSGAGLSATAAAGACLAAGAVAATGLGPPVPAHWASASASRAVRPWPTTSTRAATNQRRRCVRRGPHLPGPETAAYLPINRGVAGSGQRGARVGQLAEIVHHALAPPAEMALRVRCEFGRAYRAGGQHGLQGGQSIHWWSSLTFEQSFVPRQRCSPSYWYIRVGFGWRPRFTWPSSCLRKFCWVKPSGRNSG